jgi:hypothetical protein
MVAIICDDLLNVMGWALRGQQTLSTLDFAPGAAVE